MRDKMRRLFAVKKVILFLTMLLWISTVMPVLAGGSDYVFISDLSQYKNKKVNILTPNAEMYEQNYTVTCNEEGRNSYSISLYDAHGQVVDPLPETVKLYYPHYNRDNMAYYSYTITQQIGNDVITYSSENGSIQGHGQYGLEIETNRMGKFELSYTIADNVGPTWDELMDILAETGNDESFDYDGIRVSRSGNTVTFQGLRDDSRLRDDVWLESDSYSFTGDQFVFDNVELQEVWIKPHENENWTVHLTESASVCRGMEIWLKPNSRVHLINDTQICDLNPDTTQRDYPMCVDVPYGASFLLTGKGNIPPGDCRWYTSTMEEVYKERKSALINVFVRADSGEASVSAFAEAFSNIHLDKKQFPTNDLAAHIRTCLINNDCEMLYEGHPAAGNLSELNAGRVNLLMLGSYGNADYEIKVSVQEQSGEQAIAYELMLVDNSTGGFADLSQGADLYLPYPVGMDMETASQYDITVTHYTAFGEEEFSTQKGNLQLTPYGLCARVYSMSPFLLSWEKADIPAVDALPQTGDNSHIFLWLALLTLAGTAILTLKRKTA